MKANKLNGRRVGLTMLGTAMALGVVTTTLVSCGGGDSSSGGGPTVSGSPALKQATEATLTGHFQTALRASAASGIGRGEVLAAFPTSSSAADSAGSAVSATTVQEIGVDEADRVKTDGTFIYSIDANGTVLRRHRIGSTAPLTTAGTFAPALGTNMRLTGVYLDATGKRVAALAEGAGYGAIYDRWFSSTSWMGTGTELALVDVSDAAALTAQYRMRFDGQMVGTRRIGSTLYLALRSYRTPTGFDPYWGSADATSGNERIIASLGSTQVLPTVSINGGASAPLVKAEECWLQEGNANASADVVSIVAVDLASATPTFKSKCFVGGSEALYVSEKNLYLATTRYVYAKTNGFPVYQSGMTTDIHKFGLNGMDVRYAGSGSVNGHLGWDQNRKSFRFGESADGYLRVITHTATNWIMPMIGLATDSVTSSSSTGTATSTSSTTPAAAPSPATLTILKEISGPALQVVSTLPNSKRSANLGKAGEQIYATRFLGNRGYLVTYRLTDPLYVLDLSDPADPRVTGELNVTGYSDYLFPITENLLLGIGKEAVEMSSNWGDGRMAWYQGVKLSLIDVSDPGKPAEAAKTVIGRRGTGATVLHDHHGITLLTSGGVTRVALPVNLHAAPPVYASSIPEAESYGYSSTGLYRFEVDATTKSLTARSPVAGNATEAAEPNIGGDRSVLAGNQVHYLRGDDWISTIW